VSRNKISDKTMRLIMKINQLLLNQYNVLFLVILLLPHPTQTTLFNDIFWSSASNFHTGAIEIPYHVIHSSEGVVGAGNYTYYKLNQPGTLRLILNPLSGDPDIYISEGGNTNPSFMPEEYAISSASCGLEKIDINRSFKRPINIAVYGHPYYETSKYRLEVSIAEFEEPDPFASLEESENEFKNKDRHPEESQTSYKDYEEVLSWAQLAWEIIRSILEVLIEVMM